MGLNIQHYLKHDKARYSQYFMHLGLCLLRVKVLELKLKD
jgi:hypothetical protein